ncbi:anaerobic C4-dicarboxylate transporter family protein [Spongorhabdus nitratireducens]
MFWLQFLIVIACILVGARVGGIGLGAMGGLGLAILAFGFGLEPTSPPINVMLMMMSVVAAASVLQAAGGLSYLVGVAERVLRRNPDKITFLGPLVTYTFTFFAGTGHVAYSVLPVIAEVARKTGVRPERPLSIAVIASQQAITACPISAATVALVALLSPSGYELLDILVITLPATIIAVLIAAFFANRQGIDLDKDPEYQRRLADPVFRKRMEHGSGQQTSEVRPGAKLSVVLFLMGALGVVIFGSFPELRPTFDTPDGIVRMGMAHTIEMVMLTVAAAIFLLCRAQASDVALGSVFMSGAQAVMAIFGIAWMGDSFFNGHMDVFSESIENLVTTAPWTFALALFVLSIMVNSQAATVTALVPLGIALGIPGYMLIAMFPAVNGYFFVPNYPPIIAAIGFDITGSTRIGRFVFNHSFMLPGVIAIILGVVLGFIFVSALY